MSSASDPAVEALERLTEALDPHVNCPFCDSHGPRSLESGEHRENCPLPDVYEALTSRASRGEAAPVAWGVENGAGEVTFAACNRDFLVEQVERQNHLILDMPSKPPYRVVPLGILPASPPAPSAQGVDVDALVARRDPTLDEAAIRARIEQVSRGPWNNSWGPKRSESRQVMMKDVPRLIRHLDALIAALRSTLRGGAR